LWPIEGIPSEIRWMSKFLPITYAVAAVKAVVNKGMFTSATHHTSHTCVRITTHLLISCDLSSTYICGYCLQYLMHRILQYIVGAFKGLQVTTIQTIKREKNRVRM